MAPSDTDQPTAVRYRAFPSISGDATPRAAWPGVAARLRPARRARELPISASAAQKLPDRLPAVSQAAPHSAMATEMPVTELDPSARPRAHSRTILAVSARNGGSWPRSLSAPAASVVAVRPPP